MDYDTGTFFSLMWLEAMMWLEAEGPCIPSFPLRAPAAGNASAMRCGRLEPHVVPNQ